MLLHFVCFCPSRKCKMPRLIKDTVRSLVVRCINTKASGEGTITRTAGRNSLIRGAMGHDRNMYLLF